MLKAFYRFPIGITTGNCGESPPILGLNPATDLVSIAIEPCRPGVAMLWGSGFYGEFAGRKVGNMRSEALEERMAERSANQDRLDEIHQINRRFLELIVMRADNSGNDQYGLPADVCHQIAGLSSQQLNVMAMVPLLLVTATHRAVLDASAVHDMEDSGSKDYRSVDVAEQNFTASLMTWLTQQSQQDHTLSSLWQGTPGYEDRPVRGLSFGEIQNLARFAGRILKARLVDQPTVWTDLIESARSSDPPRQRLARLALLPRSFPIRKRPRPPRKPRT